MYASQDVLEARVFAHRVGRGRLRGDQHAGLLFACLLHTGKRLVQISEVGTSHTAEKQWIDLAGPAALTETATFPEDSTAPTSTLITTPTGPMVGGATTGSWAVRLACADPEAGRFASGCFRTEYRLDGGAIVPYTRTVEIADVGQHVFEFRSTDGADN